MTRQVTREETRQETLRSCHGSAFPRPDAPGRSAARDVQPPSFGDDIDVAWRAGADLQGCVESGHTRGHIQVASCCPAMPLRLPLPQFQTLPSAVTACDELLVSAMLTTWLRPLTRAGALLGLQAQTEPPLVTARQPRTLESTAHRDDARQPACIAPGRRAAGPVPRLRSCRASKCLARTRRQGQGLEPRDAGHRRRADDGGPGARASGGRGPVAAQCHPPVQGVRLPRCELLRIACVPLNRLGSKSHA